MTCRAPTSASSCTGGSPTGAQLSYDNEGRLTTWQNAPSSPTGTANDLYDGEGNRVLQQSVVNGTTTTTTYVGQLEEVAVSGSTTTTTATYYLGGKRIALSVNGTISYLASDLLSSGEVALNTSGGATASILYGPYGTVRYSSGTMPGSYGFTGQHDDTATIGLDYYGARYYDPVSGQFASADTDPQGGLNRYAYVHGNPETMTDPTGHKQCAGTEDCNGGGDGSAGTPPPPGSTCAANCGTPPPPPVCHAKCGGTPPSPKPTKPAVRPAAHHTGDLDQSNMIMRWGFDYDPNGCSDACKSARQTATDAAKWFAWAGAIAFMGAIIAEQLADWISKSGDDPTICGCGITLSKALKQVSYSFYELMFAAGFAYNQFSGQENWINDQWTPGGYAENAISQLEGFRNQLIGVIAAVATIPAAIINVARIAKSRFPDGAPALLIQWMGTSAGALVLGWQADQAIDQEERDFVPFSA